MVSELWFSRHDESLWAAAVEDRRIVEIHPAWPPSGALYGAIYLARVQRVVPHLGAAFVQLAPGLEGYLESPADEVRQLGSGQALAVQVRREAHEGKRARVSTKLEFTGRCMSLRPGGRGVAVSRRIGERDERRRLERWARDAGPGRLVLRTAAAGVPEAALTADRDELVRSSERVAELARSTGAPALLREAPSLIERLIGDYAGRDLRRILVETDDDEAVATAAAGDGVRIERNEGPGSLVHTNGILEAARSAMNPTVALDSGASLTIESTRALWAVDVDSGSARLPAVTINREAAERIAYEIRLRDLAGTILIDFLTMSDEEREELDAAFRRALRADRRYLRLTGWTGLGLCELARRRERSSLIERLRSAGVR